MDKYILSICIPTYNRAAYLDESLRRIHRQYRTLDRSDAVEIIVSDNCSDDDTEAVVRRYTCDGLPVRYIRNSENLGMDGNFMQCFRLSQGRYAWLLGDDDYLKDGSLQWMVDMLSAEDYGLVHISAYPKQKSIEYETCSEAAGFLQKINYWITFISGNVVSTRYLMQTEVEKYKGTLFSQVPIYLTAAIHGNRNAIVYREILESGLAMETNGGYNIFKVFVVNFLTIWKEQTAALPDNKRVYAGVKRVLYENFLTCYIMRLLLKKNNTRFKTDGAWRILWRYYGLNLYSYTSLAKAVASKLL